MWGAGYVYGLDDSDDFMDVYLSSNSSCSIHEIFLHINHSSLIFFLKRHFNSSLIWKRNQDFKYCLLNYSELFWMNSMLLYIYSCLHVPSKKKTKRQCCYLLGGRIGHLLKICLYLVINFLSIINEMIPIFNRHKIWSSCTVKHWKVECILDLCLQDYSFAYTAVLYKKNEMWSLTLFKSKIQCCYFIAIDINVLNLEFQIPFL